MSVFIHEFAHALNFAINLFDATFEERLKVAYADAKNNDESYWELITMVRIRLRRIGVSIGRGVSQDGLNGFRYQRSLESSTTPISVKKTRGCMPFSKSGSILGFWVTIERRSRRSALRVYLYKVC